jgi:GNAT superfamily N-acetyltransferase
VAQSVSHDTVRLLEQAEIRGVVDLHRAASPPVNSELGLQVVDLGGASGVLSGALDVLALNRIMGLGLVEPPRPVIVDDLLDRYVEAGVRRVFVQVAPSPYVNALVDVLLTRGMTRYNNWVRLLRGVEDVPDVATDLEIRRIGPEQGLAFGEIVTEAFGWPSAAVGWLADGVGRPGWQHYLAFDGARPVATATLHAAAETGWMSLAATRPEARGRGAQSALIVQRLRDAAALGCRRVTVETAEPTSSREAPSYRNVTRLGFQVAYLRPNYLWVS